MNINALKYEIIEWITRIDEPSLLRALKVVKDSNVDLKDWLDDLNEEEKTSLKRGISDHSKGEVLSSEEFWSGDGDEI